MPHVFYDNGCAAAFRKLGLEKVATELIIRQRKSPFEEIARRISRAFKLKMPKFDMAKLLARMLRNPLRQPQRQLSGKMPYLKA